MPLRIFSQIFYAVLDIFLESNHSYFGSIVPGLPFASKNQAQDGQMLGYSMFESEGKLGVRYSISMQCSLLYRYCNGFFPDLCP